LKIRANETSRKSGSLLQTFTTQAQTRSATMLSAPFFHRARLISEQKRTRFGTLFFFSPGLLGLRAIFLTSNILKIFKERNRHFGEAIVAVSCI
jgi:hypothetical protein